jgi:RimJ/RimL family protein N-acetyltransferase
VTERTNAPWVVRTDRLLLSAVTTDDVDELFAINSDPAVWGHFPSGRHVDRAQTESFAGLCADAWDRDGLGYWAVRDPGSRVLLGSGGCMAVRDAGAGAQRALAADVVTALAG